MASLRRPALAASTSSRRPAAARQPPAPLTSSIASSSTSSLISPPLSGPGRRGDAGSASSKRESTDGNIQVVVRCRGLSSNEAERGVVPVAEVKATRGTDVKLVDPNPTLPSSANPTTASPQTKTWDFGDRVQDGSQDPKGTVYGPDADQGMLYNDVAKPILQQVLQGYNCTIFAYGQTGTGKTYTMEGNLSPYRGTFHPEAGVIPRTLYSLFDRLAESKCEFSVRCSFIELYNEELRDLNAPDFADLSASSSTASSPEPGAAPARAPGSSAPRTLRIYEETKNGQTGVTIQGLEETFIETAEEGLRVLRRGSDRRQIAATNCNERSSRSHSIFTIVVHVKDTSKEGQDVLKVGKLNLVDLAGSENVGRSGAVQGRAREAGMINASLLALGRVINQLVDKGESSKKQHIAYRESKLTRLLQDSLGGRTKTTIIATISPASYEETASTLTYAHQAKSIQNRPEVNQRVSRNVLLNQFATEIERLKADLNAARGNEGVYVSKETWDELEAGRLSFDETKRKLEITESQLQTTRDQFEQNFRLLSTREEQLKRTQEELGTASNELAATALELEETRLRLAQQEVLRDAFETSREGWKSSAGDALDDVEGLRAKLARKSEVERANLAMIADARTAIAARTKQIDQRTTQLRRAQQEFVAELANQLDEFSNKQQLQFASTSELLDSHVDGFSARIAALALASRTTSSRGDEFRQLVETTCGELFDRIRQRGEHVEVQQQAQLEAFRLHLGTQADQVTRTLDDVVSPIRDLQIACQTDLRRDQATLSALQEGDAQALATENARLKRVISVLQANLADEQNSLRQEEEAILRRMQDELAAASTRRLRNLTATYDGINAEMEDLLADRTAAAEQRGAALAGVAGSIEGVNGYLRDATSACASVACHGQQTLLASVRRASDSVEELAEVAGDHRQDQLQSLEAAAQAVRQAGLTFRQDAGASQLAMQNSLVHLLHQTGDTLTAWRDGTARCEAEAVFAARDATARIDKYSAVAEGCLTAIDEQADDLAEKLQQDLQSQIRRDISTGKTPRIRTRPVDRLLPSIDLDSDRPTVLERLLAVRSQEVAATAAALDGGGEGVHTVVRGEEDELREKAAQVEVLVRWCKELGIQTLSVFDETGLLVRRAADVAAGLSLELLPPEANMHGCVTLRLEAGPIETRAKAAVGGDLADDVAHPSSSCASDDGRSGSSATLVNDESLPSSPSLSPFTLKLLSRAAGRPHLAQVARALSGGARALQPEKQLTTEAVSAILDALPLSEPDLLFVFGGPYLRLQGFPPWQIRLTEMYHHSSPNWLPPPKLSYEVFRPALDIYGGAEMRLGR
ncbi:hypothetical protein JCM6882_002005 [Rhodosporidiobolus microsporus]